MKAINKLVSLLFLFAAMWVSADTPPNPIGGGSGGNGTGAASPIDMYVYALGVIAVMFIVFFTKKYSSKKI
ncbi:hypothetical protein [Chryseobacterium daeguense]|uniref:hypothetical protein n=1 Tax=Chryseobacterium daeguense TaxID=412438 RepID=UPI00041C2732|nr:hypothetical protein [Chryseobacterium daeguense]